MSSVLGSLRECLLLWQSMGNTVPICMTVALFWGFVLGRTYERRTTSGRGEV